MKTKSFSSKFLVTVLLGSAFLFALTAMAQTDSVATQNNETKITLALQDLGVIYGEPVETVVEAKKICDLEKFLSDCAEIGKRYVLFSPEEEKKVDAVLESIKTSVVNDLKQCATDQCLIGVAKKLSAEISRKNPTLAIQLDLTTKKVAEIEKITTASKDVGIDFKTCREMDPDTAPIDTLRLCAKLTKNQAVQKFVSPEAKNSADNLDKITNLRAALSAGDFQCGDNTPEGCGNFCLNANADNRFGSSDAIPLVCRQIAEKFFGQEGVKQLESKYKAVSEVADFYQKKAENVSFTTLDGKILTSPEAIGDYMEEQGRLGNVPAISKGMDFMVAHGFVSPEEKDFALKMVKNIGDKGGIQNFDICQSDPSQCEQYIPEDQHGEFRAARQIQNFMVQETGFDPRRCERAQFDTTIRDQCLDATQKILPKLEALSGESQYAKKFVDEIKRNTSRGEMVRNVSENIGTQGGPGGCKSGQECSQYCSDPTHGPECIAFGAKNQVFRGDEVTQRFQEFQTRFESPSFNSGFSQNNLNNDPYPNFNSNNYPSPYPPSQYPSYSYPHPYSSDQFGGPQGQNFSGPSPECLRAIQAGDFERAKAACASSIPTQPPQSQIVGQRYDNTLDRNNQNQLNTTNNPYLHCPTFAVAPCPGGQYRMESFENGCPMYKECIPIPDYRPPFPVEKTGVCPTLPSVSSCPAGQQRVVSFSSTECGIYYSCAGIGEMPQPISPISVSCPEGQTWIQTGTTASSGYCRSTDAIQTGSCSAILKSLLGDGCHQMESAYFNGPMDKYVLPSTTTIKSCSANYVSGCAGGNQTTTNCLAGQYWYLPPSGGTGYCKDSTTNDSAIGGCTQAGGSWNASTNYCQMPNVTTAGQCDWTVNYWKTSTKTCVARSTCYITTNPDYSSSECMGVRSSSVNTVGNCGTYTTQSGCQNVTGCSWQNNVCTLSTTPVVGGNCPTGQYWYAPPSGGAGYCQNSNTSNDPGTACRQAGGTWNSTNSSCTMPTGPGTGGQSCPGGQYWNGTACVTTTNTSCLSNQYWNGSACVTSTQPTSNTCSSGQYWNGSACVSSTPAYTDPSAGCASAGGSWNGSSCVMPNNTTPGSGSYTPPAGDSGSYTPPAGSGSYTPPAGGSGSYTPPAGGGSYTPPAEGSMSPMPMQSPSARRNSTSLTANALFAIDWFFESVFGSPK